MPALEAALEDAPKMGVDEYIFLGDYCLSSPFPNEVVTIIKNMPHTHIVRGNEEDYFDSILNQDEKAWINGQYSTLYWGYNAMTKDNLNYLSIFRKNLIYKIPVPLYEFLTALRHILMVQKQKSLPITIIQRIIVKSHSLMKNI